MWEECRGGWTVFPALGHPRRSSIKGRNPWQHKVGLSVSLPPPPSFWLAWLSLWGRRRAKRLPSGQPPGRGLSCLRACMVRKQFAKGGSLHSSLGRNQVATPGKERSRSTKGLRLGLFFDRIAPGGCSGGPQNNGTKMGLRLNPHGKGAQIQGCVPVSPIGGSEWAGRESRQRLQQMGSREGQDLVRTGNPGLMD